MAGIARPPGAPSPAAGAGGATTPGAVGGKVAVFRINKCSISGMEMSEGNHGWIDAEKLKPTHGLRVLALQPMDNAGYTHEAGYSGKPRAWVIARWEAGKHRSDIEVVDKHGARQWLVGEPISWWRELWRVPDGTLIVPPILTE
jgi:hypothetical protein